MSACSQISKVCISQAFICFRLSARGLRTALRKAVFCVVKDGLSC